MEEDRERERQKDKLKKIKNIKAIIGLFGGSFSLVTALAVVTACAVGILGPIFWITTLVGGKTVYGSSKSDVPSDLTTSGIDTWTAEEKKIFDDLTKEKELYDNDFSVYNASKIMNDKNEILDVSTPISTVHYQGTVNLNVFDVEFDETIFDENFSSNDYRDEPNVKDNHTRDFYKQAGKRIGNTFLIYPGKRMLLGNMISNKVTYSVVEYDGHNSGSIKSDWSLLGKITSSDESGAKKEYNSFEAIDNISSALEYGQNRCSNTGDEWEKNNICYDDSLLRSELLLSDIEDSSSSSIIQYLKDTYEADIPPTDFSNTPIGKKFIAVRVRKQIDYELYGEYLKKVYIPYIYINCDGCKYSEYSDIAKESQTTKIYNEIMDLTNSFKHYNNEDYANGSTIIGTGGFGRVVPSSGFDYLPDEYYNQFISPLLGQGGTTTLSSCVGYYDALENTSYYCTGHDAVDIVGGGGTIVAPADGVITFCSTNYGNWGPLLGITHTLKDKGGNDTKVTSWYRHWVDLNGNVDCSTLYEARVVKQGEQIAKESNQAGSYSVARHLHFKLTASDGTVYYIEDFLKSKGVNTSSINGTTDCDQVRRTCNAYCEDKRHGCTSTY